MHLIKKKVFYMKKLILIILLGFILSGCSFFRVHKMDVPQGNIFTEEQVSQLHAGMSEVDVKAIMGMPVIVNIFTPNRMDYVYTYQPGYGSRTQKRVICIFSKGVLKKVISR